MLFARNLKATITRHTHTIDAYQEERNMYLVASLYHGKIKSCHI